MHANANNLLVKSELDTKHADSSRCHIDSRMFASYVKCQGIFRDYTFDTIYRCCHSQLGFYRRRVNCWLVSKQSNNAIWPLKSTPCHSDSKSWVTNKIKSHIRMHFITFSKHVWAWSPSDSSSSLAFIDKVANVDLCQTKLSCLSNQLFVSFRFKNWITNK